MTKETETDILDDLFKDDADDTATYAEHGQQMRSIQKRLEDAQAKELALIYDENPDLKLYRVKAPVHVYKAPPEGSSKIIPKIVEHMLRRGATKKTNKAILEQVRPQFPNHKINANIWHRPLQRWDYAAINILIKDRIGGDFSVKGCKTLSDIRKLLKAH